MKKIAILTIVSQNYGNRLQNFALQEVVKSLGFQVETIRRTSKSKLFEVKNILHLLFNPNYSTMYWTFNRKISWSRNSVDKENLELLKTKYDFFIAGSDQIWNPHYDFVGNAIDFLSFVPSNKKIAYAASFGVESIPPQKAELYKQWLSDFYKISVREIEGAKIIKELNGRDADVVLDPTIMLSADIWRTNSNTPQNVPVEYVLVYSVDQMGNELKETIEEIKKHRTVIDIKEKQKNGKRWAIGPAEFLYLIDHASLLLTDSFHGTVFALLFHTPFRVFERPGINMNSRINTLLKIVGGSGTKFDEQFWDRIDNNIEVMRKHSLEFLKKALEID